MKLSDSKGIEAVYEIVMPRPLGVDRDLLGVDLSHTAWWRSLLEERNSSRGEPISRQSAYGLKINRCGESGPLIGLIR